ncbi:MAG TPA: DNA cytosine methyltransferase [Prolixibacteraceae bacterium]|nr:DNA cytosine methyltransferase [Prolixibacteraceae bacterium]
MKYNDQMDNIPIVSFFSGGGFLDMGFEMAEFKTVFSNEIDKDFAQFYKEGMSSWSGEKREVSAITDIDEVSTRDVKALVNGRFGIIGGPPCQDFSIRGSKNGFNGLRGTLTYHYYERIMDLQPDFFLMENVPGLVLLKKTKKDFNSILDLFREEYLISSKRLNALHYGVPQNRERLFVFGVKKRLVKDTSLYTLNDLWFNWPVPTYPKAETSYNWGEPKGKSLEMTAKELPEPPSELCVGDLLIKNTDKRTIPNANEFFQLKKLSKIRKIEEGDTYRPSFKRLHRKKYSPTACYGNNEVHLHPIDDRRLSVREVLRIQGVPDSYIINTQQKLSKKFKMIGNGVPVPLAYQIALSIKKFIIELEHLNQH